jgi:hypothetical protein
MWQRAGLILGAIFFLTIGGLSTWDQGPKLAADVRAFFSASEK